MTVVVLLILTGDCDFGGDFISELLRGIVEGMLILELQGTVV